MTTKESFLLFFIYAAGAILVIAVGIHPKKEFKVDQNTHESCLYGANRAKEGFVGTQFENWNFYETCLLNLYCSGVHECHTKEIHEASSFFLE